MEQEKKEYAYVCLVCGGVGDEPDLCDRSGCDSTQLVKTPILQDHYHAMCDRWDWVKIDRYINWKYGNHKKITNMCNIDPNPTNEELENVWICPRCGETDTVVSEDEEGHLTTGTTYDCISCGHTQIPTRYTYDDVLKLKESQYSRFINKLYEEYCYTSPVFDQYEFHKRRIEDGEEEDPNAKLAEMIGEEVREANRSSISFGFGHFFDL